VTACLSDSVHANMSQDKMCKKVHVKQIRDRQTDTGRQIQVTLMHKTMPLSEALI